VIKRKCTNASRYQLVICGVSDVRRRQTPTWPTDGPHTGCRVDWHYQIHRLRSQFSLLSASYSGHLINCPLTITNRMHNDSEVTNANIRTKTTTILLSKNIHVVDNKVYTCSVTCHPTKVNTPRPNSSQTGLYSIYPLRMGGRLS